MRKIRVAERCNEIINRLNKTKKEGHPDFRSEREQRDREEREQKKKLLRKQKEMEKEEEARRKKEAELRSYSTLFKPENMTSNQGDGYDSDDFMWPEKKFEIEIFLTNYFKSFALRLPLITKY